MFLLPFDRRPRVAFVRLFGTISARPGFGGGLSLSTAAPSLDRAFGLRRLDAVFLALNSPGGSPVQSSLIAAHIRRLADEKKVPVVACVEDAAASGGYWIACAADEIVADPASILGSIGVISAGFGFQDAIARIGVERRLRTAGTEKSFLDPFGPERPEDVARLETLLEQLHGEFRAWILARRPGQKRPVKSSSAGALRRAPRRVETQSRNSVCRSCSRVRRRSMSSGRSAWNGSRKLFSVPAVRSRRSTPMRDKAS